MIQESEVRDRLIAFFVDEVSLENFEDWLVASSWDMHLDSSLPAQDLVAEIELYLSEYSSGHSKYEEMRRGFGSLIDHVVSIEPVDPILEAKPTVTAFAAYVPLTAYAPLAPSRPLVPQLV